MSHGFRLVKGDARPKPEEARRALVEREVADNLTKHGLAASHYQLDLGLETAINTALAIGSPLLVTGEPGTGKTQLAWFLGDYFGVQVYPFFVRSNSNARDLRYDFDAVGYLRNAYLAREGEKALGRSGFLTPGALWRVYESSEPSVLLIDEIDKAPRDFPNDLLHELDQGWFPHPFEKDSKGEPIRIPENHNNPPVIIITSNVERRLPGPFLRRCVFHHIELTESLVQKVVEARVGEFPHLPPRVRRCALERFWELRDAELDKPPSTGELLLWLAVLDAQGIQKEDLDVPLSKLPAQGCLVKEKEDQNRLVSL